MRGINWVTTMLIEQRSSIMPYVEISIKGRIDLHLSDWLGDLTIQSVTQDESWLSGEVADSSAVYGILSSLSSLGIALKSVSVKENLPVNKVNSKTGVDAEK
jgi:hypothetical protein